MTCSQCVGAGEVFNSRTAKSELKRYRRRGPRRTTRMLVDGLASGGASQGASILEVGGGIGAVQYELMERGASRATSVDASPAYVAVARQEATRRGLADQIEHLEADVLDVADDLADADLVALDRVVCCYPEVGRLIGAVAAKTRSRMALVMPREGRLVRLLFWLPNAYMWLRRNPFRVYVHPQGLVDAAAAQAGLTRVSREKRGLWAVAVYHRDRP